MLQKPIERVFLFRANFRFDWLWEAEKKEHKSANKNKYKLVREDEWNAEAKRTIALRWSMVRDGMFFANLSMLVARVELRLTSCRQRKKKPAGVEFGARYNSRNATSRTYTHRMQFNWSQLMALLNLCIQI